ncbi:leukocyte elastase inhibitor-like [Daphnia pulicaria]|uniref:leukocyte elastase inhibitor-like n=1 Tax=Daphnia pulicaria TaxID=35523 RepID=UPI001EEB30A5|nr:leukocyte elastase inhibitor-like [Daphnia pulicaria]
MEMSMYLLFCGILLLPVSQQLSNEQIINRQPDIITFNQRSAPVIVPFTFPSQSTGSSFNLPPVPLPPFPQPPPQNQQQFNQLHFAPAIPLPAAVNPDELVGTRGSTPKNHSTSQQIQQQNHHNNGFSIPTAMLSLALDMGRCKGNAENDCATNTVFSPLSIASTLTMLLMGSSGNSYIQLRSALGYHNDANDVDINGAYKFLMERVKRMDVEAGSSILLSIANGLFSQKQSRFTDDYINKAKEYYQSEVSELDIIRNPYGSANVINRWVSDKTKGKITNILSSLPPDTQLVIANAVYFNANWADPFTPEVTRREDFHVSSSEILTPLTMHTHSMVAYIENEELGCKMIGMPYKGEELGMFILLPTEKQGLASLSRLEDKLTVEKLEHMFSRMEAKTVAISLPKFRIQQKLQLKNVLRGLGVTDLFSPSSADLSRMTSKTGVALDSIIHQTFIEVTESGTEAAAATVLNLSRDGPSKTFAANQPFLFIIRDIPSKAVLFFGRVVRPGDATRT